MQNLKADTVRFLTRDESHDVDRDRDAAKLLARCDVDVRHVDGTGEVDVLIHGKHDTIRAIKTGETAGRLENAMRQACPSGIRMMQWVETSDSETARPGTGVGDGSGAQSAIKKGGKQPVPHFDGQGHGSSHSAKQPGDRQINPPANPRR